MDTHIVFRRTDKGADEIKTRKHHLPHKLRLALILVDGESDFAALQQKSPTDQTLAAQLEELAMQGFIAANTGDWVAHDPEQDVPEETEGGADVATVKAELIDLAILVLGDHADRVVKKLRESDDSKESLLATVQQCRKLVGLFIDEAKAEELQAKCQVILARL